MAFQIPDEEAIPLTFDLLEHEGLCLGGSSASMWREPCAWRRNWARHTIVTILCDYGTRYQSKLFNPAFLRSKNLPVPPWLERTPSVTADLSEPAMVAPGVAAPATASEGAAERPGEADGPSHHDSEGQQVFAVVTHDGALGVAGSRPSRILGLAEERRALQTSPVPVRTAA